MKKKTSPTNLNFKNIFFFLVYRRVYIQEKYYFRSCTPRQNSSTAKPNSNYLLRIVSPNRDFPTSTFTNDQSFPYTRVVPDKMDRVGVSWPGYETTWSVGDRLSHPSFMTWKVLLGECYCIHFVLLMAW